MGKPTIRMTSRVPLLVAAVLLFLQIFSPAPPIMFTLVTLIGCLALAYLWVWFLGRDIELVRERRYGWAQVGDILEERFTLHNDSWVPLVWAELDDASDLPGYDASRVMGAHSRQSMRWVTEGTCQRRGIYRLGPIKIITADPLGIFRLELTHSSSEQFVVYPPIAAIPQLIQPRGRARGTASANVRSLDFTTNASSVREYVPGDSLNQIHWRSTARRSMPGNDRFMVKEFDREPSGDLWIILDMQTAVHAGYDVESTEEYAVVLAASLANDMLRANHAVGLITHMEEPLVIPPQKGHQQLWELLRALAGVHATASMSLGTLLRTIEPLIGRGMSAAIITPSTDPEWLTSLSVLLRHGTHPTGVLLDADTFDESQALVDKGESAAADSVPAAQELADVEASPVQGVIGALADLGISAHVIGKDYEFDQISERRQQRATYRTLGTGRVVVVDEGESTEWKPVGWEEDEADEGEPVSDDAPPPQADDEGGEALP